MAFRVKISALQENCWENDTLSKNKETTFKHETSKVVKLHFK